MHYMWTDVRWQWLDLSIVVNAQQKYQVHIFYLHYCLWGLFIFRLLSLIVHTEWTIVLEEFIKKIIWKFWKFLFQLQWKYIWIFFKTGMFLSTCKQKFGNRWFFHHMRWFIADLKKIYEKYQNSSLMISFIFIDFLFNLLRCVPHQADVKMYQSICYLECNTFKKSNNERFLGCVCHKSETEWRATWQEYANIKIRVWLSAKMNNFS